MENTVKEKIAKILSLSQKFLQLSGNDVNVIDALNKLTEEELAEIKEKLSNNPNKEKINKIRLLVVDYLIENKKIDSDKIEAIKNDVNKMYDTEILRAWRSYFKLFIPFLYREKVINELKEIAIKIIESLELTDLVKYKIVDFDGPTNFGDDNSWIAIYNKKQPSQRVCWQLFIGFKGETISYGLLRNLDKSPDREAKLKNIKLDIFDYNQMINFLAESKKIIIDDIYFKRYWKFSPGEKACHWNEMKKNNIAAIGWGNHDFSSAEDIEQIKELAPEFFKEKPNAKSPKIISSFINANVGDVIYAFEGLNKVIGYGEVKKVSEYSEASLIQDSNYHNYLSIDWIQLDKPVYLEKDKQTSMFTFVDITKRDDIISEIEKYISENKDANKMKGEQNTPPNKPTSLNQILFGPPGTGKTYNTVNKAIAIANPSFKLDQDREKIKAEFDRLMNEGQIVFTTFHQSMCYEDFIEGIKPLKPLTDDSFVKYDVQPGIFKQICDKAKSNFENAKKENKNKVSFETVLEKLKEDYDSNPEIKFKLKTEGNDFTIIGFTSTSIQFKKGNGSTNHTLSINTLKQLYYELRDFNSGLGIYYLAILDKLKLYGLNESIDVQEKAFVLIIDEINRGNVSQIFGELITLIEDDKRIGKDEALKVTLPYSKEEFGVPSNLYIIGTMNTADRSVEALDAALRRRFSFEEMPPDSDLIRKEGKLKGTDGKLGEISLPDLLDTINKRLEKLLDKDHQIGHSYFISVASLDDLKLAFQNKIIPLLQEYFFGDYGKIGLVLGEGFVEKKLLESIFAYFPDADADDFSERPIFKIKMLTSDDDFINAIESLLSNKKNNG